MTVATAVQLILRKLDSFLGKTTRTLEHRFDNGLRSVHAPCESEILHWCFVLLGVNDTIDISTVNIY